ncbi:MAG: DUF3460 family protein [Zoogloeaceae bacterium]|nr:DUF3460 family protein [Zoogloeaceae bacterium]
MLFVTRNYVSEQTRWLEEQMAQHPEWRAAQQAGHAILWAPPRDPELEAGFAAARETQKPYPYDVNFSGN